MLKWALVFFVISIVAAVCGFTGVAAGAAEIARVLFFVFILIFAVLVSAALIAGKPGFPSGIFMEQSTTRNFVIAIVVVAILGLAYAVLMAPDRRTASQRIGDAIHELPQGVGKASQELGDDRTPGQKLGDDVRDAGDKIKENSDSQ